MNFESMNNLDLNGAFKIANLAVAGLCVCRAITLVHLAEPMDVIMFILLTKPGVIRIIPIV